MSAIDAMAEALAVHGYTCTKQAALEGRSGTVYTVPLLAESEERAFILDVQTDDPLPMAAVADMADVADDVGADAAVLCHTGAVEGPGHSVVLWDHDETVRVLGDARLAGALGHAPTPLRLQPDQARPVAESVTELLPPAFQDDIDLVAFETMGTEPVEEPSDDLLDGFAALAAAADENELQMPDPLALPDEGPTGVEASHPLLPIRITPDDGRARLRGKMDRIDSVQMILQPVHLLDYECDLLAEGSLRYDTVAGRVQVHGTDKVVLDVAAEEVDPQGFTRLADVPDLPGHERTLRVSEDRARQCATDFLMDTHTRMVDVEIEDDDNGFSYTEKKAVAPRPDHVRLHHIGIFHRCVWRFTGPSGHVDMDALSGHLLDEVLANAHHDTMIID